MSNKLAIEILNDYPLATETVRDWFLKKMIESFEQDNAPEDFKKQMLSRGVSDITLAIMFEMSTSILTYSITKSMVKQRDSSSKEGFLVRELL
jgi:hypothetical protein